LVLLMVGFVSGRFLLHRREEASLARQQEMYLRLLECHRQEMRTRMSEYRYGDSREVLLQQVKTVLATHGFDRITEESPGQVVATSSHLTDEKCLVRAVPSSRSLDTRSDAVSSLQLVFDCTNVTLLLRDTFVQDLLKRQDSSRLVSIEREAVRVCDAKVLQ